jgi:hypothetical protein
MEFEDKIDKIKQGLKSLNNKQLCLFSWLCGLRTLPFLSVTRNFAYWPMENRQKFLYGIFYALDVSTSIAFLDDFTSNAATAAYDAAIAAYDAAYDTAYDAKAAKTFKTAAKAARAAYDAVNVTTAAKATIKAAAYAADAVNAACDAYESYAGYIKTSAWKNLLLDDIEAIKKNKLDECNHDIGIYGELWDNFQEDLKAIGCAYWAQFYKNLFNNGFTVDKEQLERHFDVPDEIKDEGAAAVGRYLEVSGR